MSVEGLFFVKPQATLGMLLNISTVLTHHNPGRRELPSLCLDEENESHIGSPELAQPSNSQWNQGPTPCHSGSSTTISFPDPIQVLPSVLTLTLKAKRYSPETCWNSSSDVLLDFPAFDTQQLQAHYFIKFLSVWVCLMFP